MTTDALAKALKLAETWPDAMQEQLAEIAAEMDMELRDGIYRPTAEELVGIDRGLAALEAGQVVPSEEIEALLARYGPE